jgi:hypothetical protein
VIGNLVQRIATAGDRTMQEIFVILKNTPPWVFALFAVLLIFGAQALKDRTVPMWRLVIIPIVFIGWGLISIAMKIAAPGLIADWFAAAAIGGALGWGTTRVDQVRFKRTPGLVDVPGSALPLVRNLLIFGSKYGLGVAAAILPSQQQNIQFCDIAVSGVSAGYFLGWFARFALAYWRSAAENSAAETQQQTRAFFAASEIGRQEAG